MATIDKSAKIFVTGHRGLLGSSITRKLTEAGCSNLLLRTRQELDLSHGCAVLKFLNEEKPDYVIMCAAKVGGIQANMADPVNFLVENLNINTGVICSALQAGVKRLLYIGSSCMYPRDYKNPLKEEYLLAAPLEPTNEGYALAKITGAKLCEYCNRQFGTNYKTLIPCNLYGPADDFRPASSHLIAAIIDKIHGAKANGEPNVVIWGDGSARREFLYADDLAEYICSCLEHMGQLPDYLNVGYGTDHSVLEYYQMAAEVIGYDGDFVFDTGKPVGMSTKLLDSSRAYGCGWRPSTTPRDGIKRTYDYYLSQLKESPK
ncbi:MAG: GDP-L-fucose synthase family protein [Armatimonadota bacterium]